MQGLGAVLGASQVLGTGLPGLEVLADLGVLADVEMVELLMAGMARIMWAMGMQLADVVGVVGVGFRTVLVVYAFCEAR